MTSIEWDSLKAISWSRYHRNRGWHKLSGHQVGPWGCQVDAQKLGCRCFSSRHAWQRWWPHAWQEICHFPYGPSKHSEQYQVTFCGLSRGRYPSGRAKLSCLCWRTASVVCGRLRYDATSSWGFCAGPCKGAYGRVKLTCSWWMAAPFV